MKGTCSRSYASAMSGCFSRRWANEVSTISSSVSPRVAHVVRASSGLIPRSAASGATFWIAVGRGGGAYDCCMSRYARERGSTLGPSARPVAIPDDVDDPRVVKAQGVVELPLRVRWSGPRRRYDLDDQADRARVYEQVLAEGTDDDVRYYVVVDDLVDLWPDLVLPQRRAWAGWLAVHRGVVVAC